MKALVTGASGYLGASIAGRLAADGFHVILHGHSHADRAESVLRDIQSAGGTGQVVTCSLAQDAAVEETLAPLLRAEGPVDVLVNNAALARDGYMMMLPKSQWDEVMEVNLGGFFRVTRACLKGMVDKRAGRIVNLVSLAAERGNVGQAAYAASKAGIVGATKTLALEMARWNILVNAVSPGPLQGGMASSIDEERVVPLIPLGRLGAAEEVSGVVSFLCGKDASYITGQVISVNGGMGM